MRRVLVSLLLACAVVSSGASAASAQQAQIAPEHEAADFSAQLDRWRQVQDAEQKITLGEQLLTAEAKFTSWPLNSPRATVKADIAFTLGSTYLARAKGVRADNLERAIACFEISLNGWTWETTPIDWAHAHNNLALAYTSRIRGERASNLELALAHLKAAEPIFTRKDSPQDWGQLQNNLAIVYFRRIEGDRAENLEAGIAHFEAGLSVLTKDTDPLRWAMIQHNLAASYVARKRGEPADNREKAIAYEEAALTVLTREAFPAEWGPAQHNLGVAYVNRIEGDPAENKEQALYHFEQALTAFPREVLPEMWAQLQHNMGFAYASRIKGNGADNTRKAIAAYESALMVFTRDAFPRDHLRTAQLLASTLLQAGELQKAALVQNDARDTFLVLLGQGVEETETRALVSDAGPLFAESAFVAAKRGDGEHALELANEGRARLLTVAMKLQTVELTGDGRQRLDALRDAIRVQKQTIETLQGNDRAEALAKLASLHQDLIALLKRADQSKTQTALGEARTIAANGGAVVVPVVTSLGGELLVMTKKGHRTHVAIVDLPDLTTKRLAQVLIGKGVGPPGGWLGAYFVNYLEGDEQQKRWPEWAAAIDNLGPELWHLFAARLAAVLKQQDIKPDSRLVWLPSGWLGTLPLGLAQDPASKRRLLDDYEIVYAPSLEALAAAQSVIAKSAPPTLAIIINPTGDLPGTEEEGAIVASHFAPAARTVLERDAATPQAVLAALMGKTHWHFASHGGFSWQDARQSALLMHGPSRLTVGQLLDAEGLGRPRLVVLSACETGLYDITSSPDEFIGLPGSFTALGAAGVLGTLWPVSDAATALLMAKFYELHMDAGLSPPTALRGAQVWLRDATRDDLNAFTKVAAARGRLQARQLAKIESALSKNGPERSPGRAPVGATGTTSAAPEAASHPYAHPYFWGGFIHTGL
jgi:CHAT domain-containing protein